MRKLFFSLLTLFAPPTIFDAQKPYWSGLASSNFLVQASDGP